MTEIQPHTMSVQDAERLTERIRYMAMSVRDGIEKLQELVLKAQEGQAHVALGYGSWTAYIADVMGEEPLRLRSREERREVVSWLAGQGMSTRAIAPVVGAGIGTVHRDLEASRVPNGTPAEPAEPTEPTFDPTPSWDVTSVDHETGEIASRPVTGMDGKTYTQSREPVKPRRRALTDSARELGLDIKAISARAQRFLDDDRFPAQKNEVAAHLRHHLAEAIEVLTDLNNQIN